MLDGRCLASSVSGIKSIESKGFKKRLGSGLCLLG